MASHKIGIICEGATEKRGTISELIKKIGHEAEKPREMGGIEYRKIPGFRDQLFRKGCDKVILLVDSHCSDPIEKERNIREKIRDKNLDICVVVCSIESWFLCDEKAVSKVAGNKNIEKKLKNFNPDDNIHNPVEILSDLFKKCKGYRYGYKKTVHAKQIAENIDITVLEKCSESFKGFKTLVEDC